MSHFANRFQAVVMLSVSTACLMTGCGGDGGNSDEATNSTPPVISAIEKPVVQANGELLIPNVATIATPTPSHSWKVVEQTQENGVEVYSCACTAADSNLAMSLTIRGERADDFQSRKRIKNDQYETLVNTLRQQGCSSLDISRGASVDPIPDWSRRKLAGTRPDGERVVFLIDTVFREHIYFMAAISPAEGKSKEMLDTVVKSIAPADE